MGLLDKNLRRFAGSLRRRCKPQSCVFGIDTVVVQSGQSLAFGQDAPSIGKFDDGELSGVRDFHNTS
ncbi:MAG: hypothetical protein H7312_16945 [Tardiphaga sp.]|nr:hypothetical protein [Tardiphaga sp.]